MRDNSKCGLCSLYPKYLQKWATMKIFILVYGILGMIQSMGNIYIIVSLTTLEKRFKIPSKNIGVMLSGNEISQILSIFLIYFGGSGHKPRWIAIGVALSAISCFVLALPHFIYGPGKEALALTREYYDHSVVNSSNITEGKDHLICSAHPSSQEKCNESTNLIPSLLIFLSQFVLGFGTTLYYVLGSTYLDDNTKKGNIPMVLGLTFSLRTIGPVLGFVLAYFCLKIYVDPSLHPIINDKDPRWLGAWWLGWILLGVVKLGFALVLAMFPKELRVSKKKKDETKTQVEELPMESPIDKNRNPSKALPITDQSVSIPKAQPSFQDFTSTLGRIIQNKLLIANIGSGIFFVLGFSAIVSFMAKYLEVQFMMSSAGGSVFIGPLTLAGIVFGFLTSGYVIGKFKPGPRPLMAWNMVVGSSFVIGQIFFIFLGCESSKVEGIHYDSMTLELTSACNKDCHCDFVKYSPVCHEPSGITYFSACHAGCKDRLTETTFGNCTCLTAVNNEDLESAANFIVKNGPCHQNCLRQYILFSVVITVINVLSCSGRIGNVLVNFRAVETRDKSIAQGFGLFAVSLLALIPGPIIFGAIIDSTCMLWDNSCGRKGNCWVYHKENYRLYVNGVSACFSFIGVVFDIFVFYYAKDLELYNEDSGPKAKLEASQKSDSREGKSEGSR